MPTTPLAMYVVTSRPFMRNGLALAKAFNQSSGVVSIKALSHFLPGPEVRNFFRRNGQACRNMCRLKARQAQYHASQLSARANLEVR